MFVSERCNELPYYQIRIHVSHFLAFIEVGHFNEHSVLVRKKSLSRLPQDTPTCGFNGELCRSEEKTGPSCRGMAKNDGFVFSSKI